jgi:hypothetical protein
LDIALPSSRGIRRASEMVFWKYGLSTRTGNFRKVVSPSSWSPFHYRF